QDVRIETDHGVDGPRMTSFISSIDKARWPGRARIPLSCLTLTVAGRRRTCPGAWMISSTWSPGWTLKASRISFGTVIWPLLVMVALGIMSWNPYESANSLLYSKGVGW